MCVYGRGWMDVWSCVNRVINIVCVCVCVCVCLQPYSSRVYHKSNRFVVLKRIEDTLHVWLSHRVSRVGCVLLCCGVYCVVLCLCRV